MQQSMTLLVSILLSVGLAAPLAAQPRSDTLLRDEIAAAIEEANLPIGLFEVDVRDGVAVLSGEVLNETTQSRVVELALFVDGVTAVETDITVLEPEALADPEAERRRSGIRRRVRGRGGPRSTAAPRGSGDPSGRCGPG